jgi:glycosyltransferase involved in cell wall biosynthesis
MNEEGNIDEFCRQFDEMRNSAKFQTELIFIDDGSTDGTLEKIKSNAAKYNYIKFASHQRNCGLTAALQSGFEIASGEVYVFYPSDLQYKPVDIPKLIEPISNGADLCVGWKQGKYNKSFVSRIYNYLSRKIFGLKVHDLNSNYAFRKEVVEHIFLRKDWHRYLVVLAANEGYRIEEVKIPVYERDWGKSKYGSLMRIPIGVLDMVAVKFQLTFLKKPLLFFGFIGSVCFVLGFIVGLWAVYLKYWQGETQLPLLYLVILLTGLGFGLFLMGFITEGLTAINEEVSELRRKFTRISQSKSDDI